MKLEQEKINFELPKKKRIFANFGVILELITYSDVNIGIETKRK
jgi:hypothetical protein